MALKEARCTNCGSIVFVNPGQEKAHCAYCEAVFSTEEGLKIAQAPENYTFPNLPQEKYTGPDLNSGYNRAIDFDALVRSAQAAAPPKTAQVAQAEEPVFVPKADKLPDLNIPRKIKLIAIVSVVVVTLLFIGIMVPLTVGRDNNRAAIAKAVSQEMDAQLVLGKTLEFHGLKSDQAFIVIPNQVDEKEALHYYTALCAARDKALSLEAGSSAKVVNLTLAGEKGSYRITAAKGNSGPVVKKMD